jgi:hypothetical protein
VVTIIRCVGLVALLAVAGCASRTEVILAVDTDISTLDQITIEVTSPANVMQGSNATIGTGQPPLPRTLGLTWSGGALGPYHAVVTGLAGGVRIVQRTATFYFVQNETRVVHLDLVARCIGTTCVTGETCGPTMCVPEQLGSMDLTPFNGTIDRSPDLGLGPGVDGGPPPPHDSGPTGDAGGNDAFVPPPDMGHDAFVPPPVDMGVDVFTPPVDMGVDTNVPPPVDMGVDMNMCTNTQTDPNNCGFCGNVCALANTTADTCNAGRCIIGMCSAGFLNCDGRNSTGCEINGQTDPLNCNMCGHRCGGGTPICCRGACAATCP